MFNRSYLIKTICISLILFIIMLIIPITYIQICNTEKELNIFLRTIMSTKNSSYDMESYYKLLEKSFNDKISLEIIDISNNRENMKDIYKLSEVIKAKKYGYGKSLRFSKKDNKFYMFIATKHDKHIISVSKQFKIIDNNLTDLIFLLIIITIFMLFIFIYIIRKTAKKTIYSFCDDTNSIFEDIEKFFKDDIKSIYMRNTIEEFIPNIKKFVLIFKEQKSYLDYLKSKYESIRKILFSMNEGLIILDKEYNVLLSNKEVLGVFEVKDINNKNFIHIYRSEKFLNMLKKLENNKSVIFDLEKKDKKIYRVRVTTSNDGGYIIFTRDVTHVLKLEKIRSDFNSNVSHELKTPITTILGFAELISKGMVKDSKKIEKYSEKIFLESKRLINLIDDMLKLSEIESCDFVEVEDINILEVLKEVLEILDQDIKAKKISINIEGDGSIKMKYSHLLELLSNLISNAIKYNKDKGNIDVKIRREDNNIKISIKDTGIGIKKEDIDRIFERFYRVDKGRNKKIEGTGIGLSIVKHIVELYKGNIEVKSTNAGTEFIVYLNK